MAPSPVTDLVPRQDVVYTFTRTIFPPPTVTVINAVTTTITPDPTVTVIITDDPDPDDVVDVDYIDDPDGDLSGGAIAGIVIGCILGILLLILIIWSCARCFGADRVGNEKGLYVEDRYGQRRRGRSRSRSRHSYRHHHHHRHHHSRSPYRASRSTVRTIRTVSPAYVCNGDVRRASRSRSRY